jgi:hypothetical protein
MMELRNRKCSEHYGADVWLNADKKTQACFNFLCGNHTRSLPVVRFNKMRLFHPIVRSTSLRINPAPLPYLKAYDKGLHSQLGEQMRIAKQAAG